MLKKLLGAIRQEASAGNAEASVEAKKKSQPSNKKRKTGTPPENAPPSALDARTLKQRFLHEGALEVERNRYFVALMAMAGVVAMLGAAIMALTPLKEVTPYVIETDNVGRTAVSDAQVREFEPTEIQLRYFLAEWTDHMMTVRPGVTTQNLPQAFNKTEGTASRQFREHIDEYDPIGRATSNPERTVDTRIRSINFLPNQAVMIQFHTLERGPDQADQRTDYSLAINYETYRPQTEEQILENPVGLVITNFNLTRDMGGQ
ncbi:Type IV secretory pathway TrbF protein-like protein (plasmid) [Thioalkalivibrio sp. K90mix]|uniref:type IV secretion system protein n=1 Tax=Thioalkalivibrio sp. (strain K90mix) TaxID=396595 RepID=UPI000195A7B4|nr:type IV secretion system protein [Thioalkalivibrio sp. K90mix]ADC73309.1 Type IV secretory pathway TrbF protein-like protein [Thioalkalivibrio sp. K90mix]